MSLLKIALLGAPEVYHGERRLSFPERKTLALLAYLAATGTVQERQKLTLLFWPESDMAHGRTTLRINLLHLRQALGDDEPDHTPHLLVTRAAFGLDPAAGLDLDLTLLESAGRQVQQLPSPDAVQGEARRTLIATLQRAAAAYRGDFLADLTLRDTIEFDNWVDVQRAHWYQRIEGVFDWLAQLQLAAGEIDAAIATVERWRAFDPLNEDLYLRLMQLHFAASNRAAALRTYAACEEILMAELRAKPSQQLVALAEAIRNTSAARVPFGTAAPEAPPARTLLKVPFVGRGPEISRLMALYGQAARRQPQVVLLAGEAGVGKSRLATEFMAWARVQEAAVLQCRAYPTRRPLPYQPLIDSLRAPVARQGDMRALLSDSWLAELAQLLPELRERYPTLPPPTTDPTFAAARLFETLTRLGQATTARRPLVFFLDDLHQADDGTLDALQYLAIHWTAQQTAVLLLLSCRGTHGTPDPRAADWLAGLGSDVQVTVLPIEPLSREATGEIAATLCAGADGATPAAFGVWLFAATAGQPFYIKALLETLVEQGRLVPRLREGEGWRFDPTPDLLETLSGDMLPGEVGTRIEQQLARLSAATRELLAAGAVLGPAFAFADLCRVADLPTAAGLAALDEALASHVLHEMVTADGDGQYTFAQAQVCAVVTAQMGTARRRIMQARADALCADPAQLQQR